LCENLGAVSLAPLGLPGEAYQRKTALVRIEKLLAAEAYIEAVDPFSLAENGTITFLYQSWAYEDHQSLYARNLMQGTKDGRDFVHSFVFEGDGEPIFRLHFRTIDSPTAPVT